MQGWRRTAIHDIRVEEAVHLPPRRAGVDAILLDMTDPSMPVVLRGPE